MANYTIHDRMSDYVDLTRIRAKDNTAAARRAARRLLGIAGLHDTGTPLRADIYRMHITPEQLWAHAPIGELVLRASEHTALITWGTRNNTIDLGTQIIEVRDD